MLFILEPYMLRNYSNTPKVIGNLILLRSINPAAQGGYKHGLGYFELPQYASGDILQWALLAYSNTQPVVLKIGVQKQGVSNNLSLKDGLIIPNNWEWVTSNPISVDQFKPYAYLYTPDLNKEIWVQKLALGDPESIAALIQGQKEEEPSQNKKGFLGPLLLTAGGILAAFAIFKNGRRY